MKLNPCTNCLSQGEKNYPEFHASEFYGTWSWELRCKRCESPCYMASTCISRGYKELTDSEKKEYIKLWNSLNKEVN